MRRVNNNQVRPPYHGSNRYSSRPTSNRRDLMRPVLQRNEELEDEINYDEKVLESLTNIEKGINSQSEIITKVSEDNSSKDISEKLDNLIEINKSILEKLDSKDSEKDLHDQVQVTNDLNKSILEKLEKLDTFLSNDSKLEDLFKKLGENISVSIKSSQNTFGTSNSIPEDNKSLVSESFSGTEFIRDETPRIVPLHRRESSFGKRSGRESLAGSSKDGGENIKPLIESIENLCEKLSEDNNDYKPFNNKIDELITSIKNMDILSKSQSDNYKDKSPSKINVEYSKQLDMIISKIDSLIEITKENQTKFSLTSDNDRYENIKNKQEDQFLKFSKILAMYHTTIIKLIKTENTQTQEELEKLDDILENINTS